MISTTFRTVLQGAPAPVQLSLHNPILTVGSCFAARLSDKLESSKFCVLSNPFGTLFNPLAIGQILQMSVQGTMPGKQTYVCREGVFYNVLLHSSFCAGSQALLEARIRDTLTSVRSWLSRTEWLVITWGTAWGYRYNGQVVGNCHKLSADNFEKTLLEVHEIECDLLQLIELLHGVCPHVKVLLTVSPVRHLLDSLSMNAVSKSTLRLAAHRLEERVATVYYFPAYELMMDDLRDYRFYKADMIHPSALAFDYIWQFFCRYYTDRETQSFLQVWQRIQKDLAHQPIHRGSAQHKRFLESVLSKLKRVEETYRLDCKAERLHVEAQMRLRRV